MSVTLVNRLEAALGIRISAVKLIQGPSIEQLVDDLLTEFAGVDEALPRPSVQTSEDAAGK